MVQNRPIRNPHYFYKLRRRAGGQQKEGSHLLCPSSCGTPLHKKTLFKGLGDNWAAHAQDNQVGVHLSRTHLLLTLPIQLQARLTRQTFDIIRLQARHGYLDVIQPQSRLLSQILDRCRVIEAGAIFSQGLFSQCPLSATVDMPTACVWSNQSHPSGDHSSLIKETT
eukprot:1160806-Pelagomonas_calceolata.AAC.6